MEETKKARRMIKGMEWFPQKISGPFTLAEEQLNTIEVYTSRRAGRRQD